MNGRLLTKLILATCFASFPGFAGSGFSQAASQAAGLPVDSNVRGSANVHLRGDLGRLRKKLTGDAPVHVAFLGGSITQNTGGHTAMVPAWLRTQWPKTDLRFNNVGMGSTCSTSGAFRHRSHVLAKGLDLLIVEFAVNDDQDAAHAYRECLRGMEGIIRRTRTQNPDAGIIMVHFVNPPMLAKIQNGKTPVSIAAHEAVAKHYGVTSVNVAAEVAESIKKGVYTWKDYGGTHPKRFGYEIASGLITGALDVHLKPSGQAISKSNANLPLPLDTESYFGGEFVSVEKAQTSPGWKIGKATKDLMPMGGVRSQYFGYDALRANAAGESLTLKFKGRAVGAFILAGPDAGIVETRVDGGEWKRHNLYHRFSGGLNYPRSVMFHTDLKPADHRLELRISGESDKRSKGNAATILFFEVNE